MSELGASPDDKRKLTAMMDSGLRVMQEINDLREGLNESVKAIAEELQVKPAVLKRALRVAFKRSMADEKTAMLTVEDILGLTGHA